MKSNFVKHLSIAIVLIFSFNILEADHFTPVWSGNPYQPMNIFISSAKIDDNNMVEGDEIGIFDTSNKGEKICVGVGVLTDIIPPGNPLMIITSQDDPDTPEVDGFISGHNIVYNLWDESEESEIEDITTLYNPDYDSTFTPLGESLVELVGNTKPNPPTNLAITISGNDIILSWAESKNSTIYYIYRSTDIDSNFVKIDSSYTNSYIDLGAVTAVLKYFYYITVDYVIYNTTPKSKIMLK